MVDKEAMIALGGKANEICDLIKSTLNDRMVKSKINKINSCILFAEMKSNEISVVSMPEDPPSSECLPLIPGYLTC